MSEPADRNAPIVVVGSGLAGWTTVRRRLAAALAGQEAARRPGAGEVRCPGKPGPQCI